MLTVKNRQSFPLPKSSAAFIVFVPYPWPLVGFSTQNLRLKFQASSFVTGMAKTDNLDSHYKRKRHVIAVKESRLLSNIIVLTKCLIKLIDSDAREKCRMKRAIVAR